jgi:hypothetical protein
MNLKQPISRTCYHWLAILRLFPSASESRNKLKNTEKGRGSWKATRETTNFCLLRIQTGSYLDIDVNAKKDLLWFEHIPTFILGLMRVKK